MENKIMPSGRPAKPKVFKMPAPTEEQEHLAFIDYLKLTYFKFHHSPNEHIVKTEKDKHWAFKKNKMGVSKGYPDFHIIVETLQGEYINAFVEMKRTKDSAITIEQIDWIAQLKKVKNCYAKVCYGSLQAIDFIEKIKKGEV
jgi:hypothetical protein